MKLLCALVVLLAPLGVSRLACAEEQAPRVTTGAALGYAFPTGRLERGSRVSDATLGVASLVVDGAYELKPSVSAGLRLRYGRSIPTLCATSSDCTASLGDYTALTALGRWTFGAVGRFEPALDLELGYEWLSTAVSDHGVKASRGYRGWSAGVTAEGMFPLSTALRIGPMVGLSAGMFQTISLSAPGVETSVPTEGNVLHLWPSAAFRLALRF